MPGGYDGYLESLRWTAECVREAPPTENELMTRMAARFGLTNGAAGYRVSFLRKVGFLLTDSSVLVLPEFLKSWLLDRDPTPLIVRLHHEARFIGEMLKGLEQPATTADLRRWACEQYQVGWETSTQVGNRRGWLQSAALMGCKDRKLLYRTDAGSAFLEFVLVEPPLVPDPARRQDLVAGAGEPGRLRAGEKPKVIRALSRTKGKLRHRMKQSLY